MMITKKINKAIRLQEKGEINEAIKLFEEVLVKDPENIASIFSIARIFLIHDKKPLDALKLAEKGISVAPNHAPMLALYAQTKQELGQLEEAVVFYEKALEIDPNFVVVLINSAALLEQLSRQKEAAEKMFRVLTIEPENKMALSNLGILLTEFKENEKAIGMFQTLLKVDPDYEYARSLLYFEKMHVCDWTDIETLSNKILEDVRFGKRAGKSLGLMSLTDSPNDILISAKTFADYKFPRANKSLWNGEIYQHKKIRIAYVSPDLRQHPVGHLMAGVLEYHDKSRFETFAISLGIDDNSRIRERMLKAFDQFIDVQKMGSEQIAQLIRDLEIDIAIDLGGYTARTRTQIFSYRCAPIQVNYLGYPGTMAVDYMDYIIADKHVIPEEHRPFYSEKVVSLPHSYLPTDGNLKVADRTPTRAECGLPETGFVFCSFNHDYKISPQVFAIWMRLLKTVEGSVLWLMKLNEPAQKNLHQEAQRHGVDPARLIFATRVPLVEDHLARYRLAGIFLDTYPYNAHTTAADSLLAGLPVVTYMGNAFQGRVAGSLLHTLGLQELVTHSLEDYEALALKLALNPDLLESLKIKLLKQIKISPLFNTELFCRNLEGAYITMWENYQNRLSVDHFTVTKAHETSFAPILPKISEEQEKIFRLHIGGKEVKQGWKIFNALSDVDVDYVGNIKDMSQFTDRSVDVIYGSHILEHVSQNEILPTLKGFYRILKNNGSLMISVPDLEVLCRLFLSEGLSKDMRFHIMRMMFGGQIDAYDFHYIGLTYEFLHDYLITAGFSNVKRVSSFGLFKDTSDFSPYGVPISLNVIAHKVTTEQNRTEQNRTQ